MSKGNAQLNFRTFSSFSMAGAATGEYVGVDMLNEDDRAVVRAFAVSAKKSVGGMRPFSSIARLIMNARKELLQWERLEKINKIPMRPLFKMGDECQCGG